MTLFELREKLQHLESQRINLDNEILQTKREIEKLSPFSKEQKIDLFKSLFIFKISLSKLILSDSKYFSFSLSSKRFIQIYFTLIFSITASKNSFDQSSISLISFIKGCTSFFALSTSRVFNLSSNNSLIFFFVRVS